MEKLKDITIHQCISRKVIVSLFLETRHTVFLEDRKIRGSMVP
jgi:hypothetical protein